MVGIAPDFFTKNKMLHITYAKVAEEKIASIMNDIIAIPVSVTFTDSSCFPSNSISYFVIYIINEEILIIFNQYLLFFFVIYCNLLED